MFDSTCLYLSCNIPFTRRSLPPTWRTCPTDWLFLVEFSGFFCFVLFLYFRSISQPLHPMVTPFLRFCSCWCQNKRVSKVTMIRKFRERGGICAQLSRIVASTTVGKGDWQAHQADTVRLVVSGCERPFASPSCRPLFVPQGRNPVDRCVWWTLQPR